MNEDVKNDLLKKIDYIFIEDFDIMYKAFININKYLESKNLECYENYNNFCNTIKSKFKNYLDNVSDKHYNNTFNEQLDIIFESLITDKLTD